MKKSVLFFMFIVGLLAFNVVTPVTAIAGTNYMRVIDDATPFFGDENGSRVLFYLPYTYYVNVIGVKEGMAHVECYGNQNVALDGYVPENLLYLDNLPVENPYLSLTVSTCNTTLLYKDSGMTEIIQYVFNDRKMDYYGAYNSANGETLYFVGYNGKLGYVKEADLYPFIIPNHPNELTFIKPEPDDDEKTVDQVQSYAELRYIIIGCLGVAGVIALVVTIKKKPQPHANGNGYYDENDFE